MSDDEVPQLPPDTLAILNEFLQSKDKEETSEDWQLSQFWYDEETTLTLTDAVEKIAGKGKVALISCPTLMQSLIDKGTNVTLFEYDQRFEKFGDKFCLYDYRNPLAVDKSYHNTFDLIVADPPFLSEECLTKAMETVKLLQKTNSSPIILCTGAVMESLAEKLGGLKPCSFIPRHKNNLANEFRCYTNFGELPVKTK